MAQRKLLAAVIDGHEEDIPAVLVLLGQRLQQKIDYIHYEMTLEIDCNRNFDFLITSHVATLHKTIARYRKADCAIPLIIHLQFDSDEPDTNFEHLYPGVPIMLIRQAYLDRLDATLQIELFEEIVARLGALT